MPKRALIIKQPFPLLHEACTGIGGSVVIEARTKICACSSNRFLPILSLSYFGQTTNIDADTHTHTHTHIQILERGILLTLLLAHLSSCSRKEKDIKKASRFVLGLLHKLQMVDRVSSTYSIVQRGYFMFGISLEINQGASAWL